MILRHVHTQTVPLMDHIATTSPRVAAHALIDLDALAGGVLLTEAEATGALRLGIGTLRKWRREKRGPEYLILSGGWIRYRVEDVRKVLQPVHRVA